MGVVLNNLVLLISQGKEDVRHRSFAKLGTLKRLCSHSRKTSLLYPDLLFFMVSGGDARDIQRFEVHEFPKVKEREEKGPGILEAS